MKDQSHKDEDTRQTSQKELWGWYAYGFAAEGSFIPITLEQLARERGVLLSDHETPCNKVQQTAVESDGQCIIHVLGQDINTASFALYAFSISVLFQALLIISVSGAADHGRFRKSLLVAFAGIGAIATMLFLFVTPRVYILGALLAVVSNTCFGASFVLLNSFLPLLVRWHPDLQTDRDPTLNTDPATEGVGFPDATGDEDDLNLDSQLASSSVGLLQTNGSDDIQTHGIDALQLSTRISSTGIGIGYVGAFIFQILALILVWLMDGTLFSLRTVLFFIGAWWFLFTIPSAVWLRPRPGPSFKVAHDRGGFNIWVRYLTYSWRSLGRTILRARQLKDVLWFLAAWFLLSDAIATISSTAVLFAKTTLHMEAAALALINVVVMLSGVLGAFFWRAISSRLGFTPMQTVRACLGLFAIIPFYAMLGFIEALPFGLKHPWEMYPLALVYGLVLGGLSSYCRSIFAALIPPGSEAAFYSLYAVTDKGSSVLGPAVVGAIIDRWGEIRPAFVFLTVLIFLPGLVLAWVDLERGAHDAKVAAGVLGDETSQDA